MHTDIRNLTPDGFLLLEGDPTLWIRSNPDLCQSVRHLSLDDPMGCGKKVIGDSIRELTKLTHLSIDGMDITDLPYKISSLRNLQILDLTCCCDKLQELPPNLGDLESLTSLSISLCSSLKCLPDSLAKLSKLTKLDISRCDNLEELPANLGELESLTQLTLRTCHSIKSLPDSVAKLRKLTTLDIKRLKNLRDLPANLGELKSLTSLSIMECTIIKFLPDSLPKLSKLSKLHISYCKNLEELPANLGELESLTQLTLCCCDSIKSLPDSVAELSKLTTLNIQLLPYLPANLGELKSLTSLSIMECTSIKFLPDSLPKLSKLSKLHIGYCKNLEELPANLGELESLTQLTLRCCDSIKSLPDSVAELSKLTTLNIENLQNLRDLPANLGELKSLTRLYIMDCGSLRVCPSNVNVVDLSLIRCCSIQSLPRGWSNLDHLVLSLCSDKAEQILANLIYLRHLQLQNCLCHWSCVKELPENLDKLPQLSVLDIRESGIKHFPSSIMNLSQLRLLFLPYDFKLQTLPSQLDESLIITVKGTNIRKTWKELKEEMEIFTFPNVRVGPSEYLQLTVTEDSEQWFPNSMVRILDLELMFDECGDSIIDLIAELELTHLYIRGAYFSNLPPTLAKLRHLFLCFDPGNDIESISNSLGKLSTLEYLHLKGTELPAQMDLPVSLRHLTLHLEDDDHYKEEDFVQLPDSMTKLSNLKVLHLIGGIQLDILPGNLNPEKLKLEDCDMTNIKSLPEGLKHVEIIHTRRFCACYELGICLNQLVYVETLSITCHYIKFLPSIVGLHHLQELQLKDCFSIKELPPNLDLMVNLHTINVSGTRIKSLPSSISNLPKLQCLILPKCFQTENLPLEFRDRSVFDDTDDKYYKAMGYYHPYHEKDDDNTTNTIAVISKSQQQLSPYQPLNQPNATLVLGDSHGSIESEQLTADNRLLKIQNPCFPSSQLALHPEHGLPPNFQHDFSSGNGKNLLVSENGQNEDNMLGEGYNFLGKDHNLVSHHSIHHLRNQEMPKNIRVNEEVSKESEEAIIAEQQQTSPQQLLSLPADALSGILEEIITESFSFGRNSQHTVQNGQVDITNSDTGHEITFLKQGNSSCNQKDVSLIENNLDALENRQIEMNSENEDKKGKRKRNEITREEIQSQFGKKQKDAAIELGVKLSTIKRRCRELGIKEWPSSRLWRRTNKRKASSKSPSKSEYSQHVVECLDGVNQHVLLPDHVSSGCIVENNSTLVATQQHRDSDQRVQQHFDGANLGTSYTIVQPNECTRTIVVKATYKNVQVKVYFSLSSSVELLKEKIGKKLKLEVDKFKMEYQDEDQDWLLVADISDLEDALRVSESSGSNVVRLCIDEA